jgi:hypothetical protein
MRRIAAAGTVRLGTTACYGNANESQADRGRQKKAEDGEKMVGLGRLELPTSPLSGARQPNLSLSISTPKSASKYFIKNIIRRGCAVMHDPALRCFFCPDFWQIFGKNVVNRFLSPASKVEDTYGANRRQQGTCEQDRATIAANWKKSLVAVVGGSNAWISERK